MTEYCTGTTSFVPQSGKGRISRENFGFSSGLSRMKKRMWKLPSLVAALLSSQALPVKAYQDHRTTSKPYEDAYSFEPATTNLVRRTQAAEDQICVLPKEEALCRDKFYESCYQAVCFGSRTLCNALAPEEEWFLGLCIASEALGKATNCECFCENTVSKREGAVHCYGDNGIDVTKPVAGNCEAGGICRPEQPLCELQRYFFFATLGYGVALSKDSEWNSSLDYFGPESGCEFMDDGKSNDAVVCANAGITEDDEGRNYCDVTFAGTNDGLDIVRYVLHLLAPNEGRSITFGTGENEISFTALELLADIAFGPDEHNEMDGIVEKAYKAAEDKGCFNRTGAAIHLSAHSLAAALANFFVLKLAAEYPDVYVKMTTIGEPAVLIKPLEGKAARLQAWSNKDRFINTRILPRGEVFNNFMLEDREYGLRQDHDWVAQVLPGAYVAQNNETNLSFLCEVKNGNSLEYFIAGPKGCADEAGLDTIDDLPDFPHKGGLKFGSHSRPVDQFIEIITTALENAGLDDVADLLNFLNVASVILEPDFRDDFFQIFDLHFMRRPLHLLNLLYQNGQDCSATRRVIELPSVPEEPDNSNAFVWWCFAEDNTVDIKDKGSIAMKDLKIGDKVKTANGYDTVYSFGHFAPEAKAEYLEIHLVGDLEPLSISKPHMLFVNGKAVPASMVAAGDQVSVSDGGLAKVQSVKTVVASGAYAPFTTSGTIVVNGVVTSNFVTLQEDTGFLHLGYYQTPFSWHWLALVFEAPHRLVCMHSFSYCQGETYGKEGISNWVAGPLRWSEWLIEQKSLVVALILVIVVPLALAFYVIELALLYPVGLLLVSMVIPAFFYMRKKTA